MQCLMCGTETQNRNRLCSEMCEKKQKAKVKREQVIFNFKGGEDKNL